MIKYLVLFFILLSSCSTPKHSLRKKEKIKVNDCLYFRKQKIFVIDENEVNFLLFSEINNMKYVYSDSKDKVNKFALKVKCPQNKKLEVYYFLENHY